LDPSLALFQSISGAAVALIAIVVVGWFAIVRLRRWMRADSSDDRAFMLDDLRRLHREGKLTSEEFQKARDAMIEAVQKSATRSLGPNPELRPGLKPELKPEATTVRSRPADRQASPSDGEIEDFGVKPPSGGLRADRTHPPTPPKRPPQLDG